MNNPPGDLDVTALATALSERWGFQVTTLTYVPAGFGSHHWLAVDHADGAERARAWRERQRARRAESGQETPASPRPG